MQEYTPFFQEAFDNFYKMYGNILSIDWVIKFFNSGMKDKAADLIKGALFLLIIYKACQIGK